MATKWKYLPILKWKQGERIALKNLTAAQWQGVVVLLELPAILAKPDGPSLRAALPDYLSKIAKELEKVLSSDKPVAIDVRHVAPGYPKQINLLRVICKGLVQLAKRQIIPVISDAMVVQEGPQLESLTEFTEHVLRIMTPFASAGSITALVKSAHASGILKKNLHLLVDQYSIVNEDPKARVVAIRPYLDEALGCGCASTTISGGSFPVNLMGVAQGIKDIQRVEWVIWKALKKHADYSEVRYSDYTVSNPAPVPDMDPKMVNPSVAIRYASDGFWRLFKAGGFKKGKPDQYKNLCTLLLGDAVYSGAAFSYGDDCYDKAANAKLGNGNPSSWRRDATSHHLVLTAAAL